VFLNQPEDIRLARIDARNEVTLGIWEYEGTEMACNATGEHEVYTPEFIFGTDMDYLRPTSNSPDVPIGSVVMAFRQGNRFGSGECWLFDAPVEDVRYAKLTGIEDDGKYQAIEVELDLNCAFQTMTGGLTWETSGTPLLEINAQENAAINDIVEARKSSTWFDGTGEVWTFQKKSSAGATTCTATPPDDYAGGANWDLEAWWFGDDISATDQDPLDDVFDSSANSHTISATSTERPLYIENVASANNQPGFKFDGTNDQMQAAADIIGDIINEPSTNEGFLIHVVYADHVLPGVGDRQTLLSEVDGSGDGVHLGMLSTLSPESYTEFKYETSTGVDFAAGLYREIFAGGGVINAQYDKQIHQASAGAQVHGFFMEVNGEFGGGGVTRESPTFPGGQGTAIGADLSGAGVAFLEATIMSIAIFRFDSLDPISRAGLDCWAFEKYGLSSRGFSS